MLVFFTKFTLLLSFTFFTTSYSNELHSFSFTKFNNNSMLELIFLGHSSLNTSFIQINNSGTILYTKPIILLDSNPSRFNKVSFSTYFVFSLTRHGHGHGHGHGLSFVLKTNGSIDPGFNLTFGGILSDINLKKSINGKKLQCWIDFESNSNRIEVRVSRIGEKRSVNSVITHKIDLSTVFGNKKVYMSLELSNTTRVFRLYSWSFKLWKVPNWMHSQPLDPQGFKKDTKQIVVVLQKRNDCVIRVFTALVFGTGCGALGAFIFLCVCRFFVDKKPASASASVAPEGFDCDDKIKAVVVDKCDNVKDGLVVVH